MEFIKGGQKNTGKKMRMLLGRDVIRQKERLRSDKTAFRSVSLPLGA